MPPLRDRQTGELFAGTAAPAVETRTHASAPDTSREAAARMAPSIEARYEHLRKVALAARGKGITSHEIGRRWPEVAYASYRARASELKQLGWLVPNGERRDGAEVLVHRDFTLNAPPLLDKLPPTETMRLRAEVEELRAALETAVKVADEAREEWDAAPSGMRAGKLLIALSGHCPGYRADIDAIHRARA